MRMVAIGVTVSVCLLMVSSAAVKSRKPLQIYFIDVEGGQSTLIVSPEKHSLLIDAGWAGERDAQRIVAAAKAAGIKQIDYLVITHYHSDHVGGVPALAKRIPIRVFVDHGPDTEDSVSAKDLYAAYEKAFAGARHVSVKPGEGLPFHDIRVEFLTAAGEHIAEPLPGAGEANPYCSSEKDAPVDSTENSQSLGLLVTYGRFRFLDLGDLTKRKEMELLCPDNLIGTVDLYLTTHHGAALDNPTALVWAVHPRVAVMNNGARKGGNPDAWQVVHDSPDLEGFWQLHYAIAGGKDHNVAGEFIANTDESSDGHFLKVTATPDGRLTVVNARSGNRKTYDRN